MRNMRVFIKTTYNIFILKFALDNMFAKNIAGYTPETIFSFPWNINWLDISYYILCDFNIT